MNTFESLQKLAAIDFSSRGESYVESSFLTPLLEQLGYEQHKDYEVIQHGDNDSKFKLAYPPVEHGAKRVKHYNPDYIPTIRKKMFWVIEAKSPSYSFPFEYNFAVQGFQYCIHPEIQAKYLVLSNGQHTAIYDPQDAVFSNGNMYEPIYEFTNTELVRKWEDIYSYLGVEKLRTRIEDYLENQYEKLCISSLDERYPERLAQKITNKKAELKGQISKHVISLRVSSIDREYENWQKELESASIRHLEIAMEYPIQRGKEPSQHYVERLLKEEQPSDIFRKVIAGYNLFSYFKKEHCFIAICHLYSLVSDKQLQEEIKSFALEHMTEKLSPLNKAESALIRIFRKIIVISAYPKLRAHITRKLKTLPELERFVKPPTARQYTISHELGLHDQYFVALSKLKEPELLDLIPKLLEFESKIQEDFENAKRQIPYEEVEINGLELYGAGDTIYTLKNIACNLGLISKEFLNSSGT